MNPALLTLNAGSSSLKFSVFIMNFHKLERIFRGNVEILDKQFKFTVKDKENKPLMEQQFPDDVQSDRHSGALSILLKWLKEQGLDSSIKACGHRVVHGGDYFKTPVIIQPAVLTQLESLIPLAPEHQSYNLAAIKALNQFIPDLFQAACFDTAFHTTQSEVAEAYALPEDLSPIPIKRYGFHGLSYEYISQVLPGYLGSEAAEGKIVIAHLGHGASMCAIQNRRSIATTMGFTALEGLPMGTRCGSIDPGIILYLLDRGMPAETIKKQLYQQSGLLGISGISSDTRLLLSSSSPLAKKAIDVFIYRFQRELGSLTAALGGIDSLVFTAGIGENSQEIRARICEKAEAWLPVALDQKANQSNELKISQSNSKITVWVIPTDEELIIAQHTFNCWRNSTGSNSRLETCPLKK